VLLPPSLTVDPAPGAPKQYQWITPLPRSLDLIPRIDPANLMGNDHALKLTNRETPGGPPKSV
jgi:hypothetical protein